MYEKVENCPICEGKEFKNEIICQDYTVTQESFAIVSCKNCNLWITSPRPTADSISKYYESEKYISHSNKPNTLVNWLYQIVRNYTLTSKVSILKTLVPYGIVFDYGCGTGDFLERCANSGYKTIGLEPNDKARNKAESKTGQTVLSSIDQHNKDNKANIITLWHVLEHVADLNTTLEKLRKRLVKDGYLIIAVPNRESSDASYYKEAWAAYDVPRHLYHFSQVNIKKLAKQHNFKLVKTIPQYFDSYYVSLLSEKYKGNKWSFIRGIIKGFRSNIYASKNKKQYSSLIYILKK